MNMGLQQNTVTYTIAYSQMVYYQEYADSYYAKRRERSKQYYWKNRAITLEKQ